jgi:hypothetical protein
MRCDDAGGKEIQTVGEVKALDPYFGAGAGCQIGD